MTNDELWSHCDWPTECPDCTSKTVIVDVSEILADPAALSLPLDQRDHYGVQAIYCPTCDEILSTRLVDSGTGQSVVGRRIRFAQGAQRRWRLFGPPGWIPLSAVENRRWRASCRRLGAHRRLGSLECLVQAGLALRTGRI
jgi:hypothetical protein